MIVHFNVDSSIASYLRGEKNSSAVDLKTIKQIKNKDKIKIMTVKSQSQLTKKVLDHFPNLELVVTRTVGIDHIDLDACRKRKIAVYNVPNYGAENVAQHTIALLLTIARKVGPANRATHKGHFNYREFLGLGLKGKTLGVIGTGKIGLEVIKIAKSLGMEIVAFDIYKNDAAKPYCAYVTLTKLLKKSDVVTLHIPATNKTFRLLDEKNLNLMKKGTILINTARGDLIDTKALLSVIDKFWGVGLDVLEKENSFSKNEPLLRCPNVIITPHIAFFTDESQKVIGKETLLNIKRYQRGDKTNRVV